MQNNEASPAAVLKEHDTSPYSVSIELNLLSGYKYSKADGLTLIWISY